MRLRLSRRHSVPLTLALSLFPLGIGLWLVRQERPIGWLLAGGGLLAQALLVWGLLTRDAARKDLLIGRAHPDDEPDADES